MRGEEVKLEGQLEGQREDLEILLAINIIQLETALSVGFPAGSCTD